jgi:hypothetical protein
MLPPSTSIFPLNGLVSPKQERQNVVQNLMHVNNAILEQQRLALEGDFSF